MVLLGPSTSRHRVSPGRYRFRSGPFPGGPRGMSRRSGLTGMSPLVFPFVGLGVSSVASSAVCPRHRRLTPRIWTPPLRQARAVSNLLLLREHKLSVVGVLAALDRKSTRLNSSH